MSRFETIVLTDDQFGEDLWCAVARTLEILMQAEYTCQVSLDDEGIVKIDYNYDERMGFGNATPCWFYPDEVEILEEIINEVLEDNNDKK